LHKGKKQCNQWFIRSVVLNTLIFIDAIAPRDGALQSALC